VWVQHPVLGNRGLRPRAIGGVGGHDSGQHC